jgi:hypothetical protein
LGEFWHFFEPEKYDFYTYKVFLCKKDYPNLLNFQKKKKRRFLQQVPACSLNEFLKISTFIVNGQIQLSLLVDDHQFGCAVNLGKITS